MTRKPPIRGRGALPRARQRRGASQPRVACLLVALALAGGGGRSAAQEPGPDAAAPSDTTRPTPSDTTAFREPVAIEPVVVTVTRAQKQDVESPRAISVVGQEDVQLGQRTLTIDESLRRIPGTFAQNRNNFSLGERLSIRGFGARSAFGIRGVKILLDGIPQTLPDGQSVSSNIDLASAGRIEVIRGPSSSLYGNAAGGVVEVFTEVPPSEPTLSTSYTTGRFALRKYQAKLAGRSGELGYVLDANRLDYAGFRDHSDVQNTLVNANVTYTPDERSLWRGILNYNDTPEAQSPGALTAAQVTADPSQANAPNVTARAGESHHQAQAGVSWSRQVSDRGTLSARLYGLTRGVDNPLTFGIVRIDRTSGGGGLQYDYGRSLFGLRSRTTAGVDLDLQADDRRNFANVAGSPGDKTLDQDERVTGIGVYVQNETLLNPELELTLGLRYDRVRFSVNDRLLADGDDSGVRTLDEGAVDVLGLGLSPMAGLRYSPAPAVNLYANVATSFQTPTTTELANRPSGAGGFNPDLGPQRAVSYEIGVKGVVGEALTYQLAGFIVDVRDELIPFEVPDQAERQFFRNAGSSRHDGVEASLAGRAGRGLRGELSYTYSDFTFRDFRTAEAIFDGNRIPGVPPHNAFAQLGWDDGRLPFAYLETQYVDAYFVDDANTTKNGSYVVLSLRAGWRGQVGGLEWRPFLGVDNLLDDEYNGSVVVNAFGGRYFEPSPGRSLYGGLGVAYTF